MSKSKLILILFFIVSSISVFGYEVILDFEPEGELSSNTVAIIPFTKSTSVEDEVLKYFYDNFIIELIRKNEYRPVSINQWYYSKYKDNTFSSVNRLLNSIVRGRMTVRKLSWAEIVKIEEEYLLTLYWYDIRSKRKSMYQRLFNLNYTPPLPPKEPFKKEQKNKTSSWSYQRNRLNIEKDNKEYLEKLKEYKEKVKEYQELDFAQLKKDFIDSVLKSTLSSIFSEMELRNEREKRVFNKSILIKKANVTYFNYSSLSSGEEVFSEVPILQYNLTPLKDNEDFFSSLFEYSFYKTGLVYEYSDKLGDLLKKRTPLLTDFSYVVDTNIKVSTDFTILEIIVRNPKWPPDDNVVVEYNFPIKDISFKSLQKAIDKNTQLVLLNILNDKDNKKIGVINLKDAIYWSENNLSNSLNSLEAVEVNNQLEDGLTGVFVNDIYCGTEDMVSTQLLKFGENKVKRDNTIFKVFISPYWMNSIYFSTSEGLLMEDNL